MVVVVVVVVVVGEAMQFGVRENLGRYDNLDYDNDNDATSIPYLEIIFNASTWRSEACGTWVDG